MQGGGGGGGRSMGEGDGGVPLNMALSGQDLDCIS